jgi:hypothetical protein
VSARAWTAGGIAIVIAHALALPLLMQAFARPELAVEVRGAPAAARGSIDGRVDPALVPRLEVDDDGARGPGLHHTRWTVRYRGGVTRTVGAVQLVGPFQDPASPACSARVIVGQRFLDDGRASPGTVAHTVVAAISGELRDYHQWTIGSFRRVKGVTVAWAQLVAHPLDALLLHGSDAPSYVRATATIEFDRVDVPITVLLVPTVREGRLHVDVRVRARLDFGNRVADWLSDKLDGDDFATDLARQQIGDGLIAALGPPPPLDLGGGRTVRFDYCGRAPEIVDGQNARLPLAVILGGPAGPDRVLPPRLGEAARLDPPRDATVTLDLDLDAANAILFELWRTGFLDEALSRAGLDRRFNDDPAVQDLLSVRLSPLRLALPPVVRANGGALRLEAEAMVNLGDGGHTTLGRVWGGLDFHFSRDARPADVTLGPLELSCVAGGAPRTLVPCYADLVAALRDRAGDLHGALTDAFARILAELFVDRHLSSDDVPAGLVIRGVRASAITSGDNGVIRLDLDAAVAE